MYVLRVTIDWGEVSRKLQLTLCRRVSLLHVLMVKLRFRIGCYHDAVSTLHCALENGSDLHVNERQKIRHYRARSTEE